MVNVGRFKQRAFREVRVVEGGGVRVHRQRKRERGERGGGQIEKHPKEHLLRLGLARDPLQLAWQLCLAGTMAAKERDTESGTKL